MSSLFSLTTAPAMLMTTCSGSTAPLPKKLAKRAEWRPTLTASAVDMTPEPRSIFTPSRV